MINRAEPRACGCGRQLNGHGCKVIASSEASNAWTHAGGWENAERWSKVFRTEGPPVEDCTSNRVGENPPHGMNGGDWGNMSRKAACAPVPLDFKIRPKAPSGRGGTEGNEGNGEIKKERSKPLPG